MNKKLLWLLRLAIPLAIIVWLVANIDEQQMRELTERPKQWPLLGLAAGIAMIAVCITFLRWYLLVRTLEIPFRVRDAFRLGFLGYLLNFVSAGSVGGDLFKAVFIAREQPGRRTKAVASVLVDRLFGLYALLLVASGAILLGGAHEVSPDVRLLGRVTLLATSIGGAIVVLLLIPGFTGGRATRAIGGVPKLGPLLVSVMSGIRLYRDKPLVLATAGALSMLVHCMLAVSIFLAASAMFETTPTLGDHFVIVPLSKVVGALPFTPAGLGAFELALDKLYLLVPATAVTASGVTVALAYRMITIAIAGVGVVYYWACRREVREVLTQAECQAAQQPENAEVESAAWPSREKAVSTP